MARTAIADFEAADSIAAQRKAWWNFLLASSGVYEKLKAGARDAGGRTAPWFGKILRSRKDDELLSYLHHARDCEYHGLDEAVGIEPAMHQVFPFLWLHEEIDEEASISAQEKAAKATIAMGYKPARLTLIAAKDDRYGDSFDPPSTHLGARVDGTDSVAVAKASLVYLDKLLDQAETFI